MISNLNKIRKKEDFDKVFAKGKYFSCNRLVLRVLETKKELESRVGFSIGLKFSKSAVKRNRLKRQFRQIFSRKMERIRKGFDIVVLIRTNYPDNALKKVKEEALATLDLEKMAECALKKANLL